MGFLVAGEVEQGVRFGQKGLTIGAYVERTIGTYGNDGRSKLHSGGGTSTPGQSKAQAGAAHQRSDRLHQIPFRRGELGRGSVWPPDSRASKPKLGLSGIGEAAIGVTAYAIWRRLMARRRHNVVAVVREGPFYVLHKLTGIDALFERVSGEELSNIPIVLGSSLMLFTGMGYAYPNPIISNPPLDPIVVRHSPHRWRIWPIEIAKGSNLPKAPVREPTPRGHSRG